MDLLAGIVLAFAGVVGYLTAAWSANFYTERWVNLGLTRSENAERVRHILLSVNRAVGAILVLGGAGFALYSLAAGAGW